IRGDMPPESAAMAYGLTEGSLVGVPADCARFRGGPPDIEASVPHSGHTVVKRPARVYPHFAQCPGRGRSASHAMTVAAKMASAGTQSGNSKYTVIVDPLA